MSVNITLWGLASLAFLSICLIEQVVFGIGMMIAVLQDPEDSESVTWTGVGKSCSNLF